MQKIKSRSDELVMIVAQDNIARSLKILEIDTNLAEMLGLKDGGANDLWSIFASKCAKEIKSELQFSDENKDFLEIITHMRSLNLRDKNGKELEFEFRAVREVPQNRCHVFRLILLKGENHNKHQALESLRLEIAANTNLDLNANLPDYDSLKQFVVIAKNYSHNKAIETAFVHVEITPQSAQLSKIIGQAVRRNLRSDDCVGLLADCAIGAILIDVNVSTLHLAITRLRMSLQRDPIVEETYRRNQHQLRFGCVLIGGNFVQDEIMTKAKQLLDSDKSKDMIIAAN